MITINPVVSVVNPFGGYLLGSLIYNWFNQQGPYDLSTAPTL